MGRILIPLIAKAESKRAAQQETVLQHAREHVKAGELAVTTPWSLGHMHRLLPIAIEFLDSYPDIALRLVLTDRVVNTVSESIGVAIRIGTLPDSSMMAIRPGSGFKISRCIAMTEVADILGCLAGSSSVNVSRGLG